MTLKVKCLFIGNFIKVRNQVRINVSKHQSKENTNNKIGNIESNLDNYLNLFRIYFRNPMSSILIYVY